MVIGTKPYFFFNFYVHPPQELIPVLGPLERCVTPTLDAALLCSSRAGSDLDCITINTGYTYESIRIGPSGIRTHDLSIVKLMCCQLCHHDSVYKALVKLGSFEDIELDLPSDLKYFKIFLFSIFISIFSFFGHVHSRQN